MQAPKPTPLNLTNLSESMRRGQESPRTVSSPAVPSPHAKALKPGLRDEDLAKKRLQWPRGVII